MGEGRKAMLYAYILLGLSVFCTPSVHCQEISISFDALLPITWYQRGLESSLSVWQQLIDMQSREKEANFLCDDLLGKLAFTHFCVYRMVHDGVASLYEDRAYLENVLLQIQSLLDSMMRNHQTYDFLFCARELIGSILAQLCQANSTLVLHIPCNIKSITTSHHICIKYA